MLDLVVGSALHDSGRSGRKMMACLAPGERETSSKKPGSELCGSTRGKADITNGFMLFLRWLVSGVPTSILVYISIIHT